MNNIGIVRRIDNLGRIVIPMEIRRNLKIKVGDPLEINIYDKEILIKKFSMLDSFGKKSSDFADSLSKSLDLAVIITDLDKIACATIENKEKFEGESCTKQLLKSFQDRKTIYINNKADVIPILLKIDISYTHQLIVPIILNNEIYGSIIALSNKEISENKIQVVEIFADILAKAIE